MATLKKLAADGVGIIVVSSELEDLEALCDRVIVLSHGEIVGELGRPEEITVRSILQLAFRAEEAL
jgi:ABC-type sugar transport system ATPase subunit